MKTILATAYAINPSKGSEDGTGWNFVMQIARFNRVIVVTRKNNRRPIENYQHFNPDERYARITFLYFDLPKWMRFWKRGGRGALLYFWMWQYALPQFIRKQNVSYDIVHSVNFHNDWIPSYLWKLNKPFVYGPIGHHPSIPLTFIKHRPLFWFRDRMTVLIKQIFWKTSRALQRGIRKADHVLCINSTVNKVHRSMKNWSLMPAVATEDYGWEPAASSDFSLLSAGRLVQLKGFDLGVEAFARFVSSLPTEAKKRCSLTIVGSGPELPALKKIADDYNVTSSIRFIPWIQRISLMNIFRTSVAFLFPSHEGAGMVVAEALSFGLPVICLDNAGPGKLIDSSSGIAVTNTSREQTIRELEQAIRELYHNPRKLAAMRVAARDRFENHFHWNIRGNQLLSIYNQLT